MSGDRNMKPAGGPVFNRRLCECGCVQVVTHIGRSGLTPVMAGCEQSVRRWVRAGGAA